MDNIHQTYIVRTYIFYVCRHTSKVIRELIPHGMRASKSSELSVAVPDIATNVNIADSYE